MTDPRLLLILGGTADAVALAEAAAASGWAVLSSLAGRTEAPVAPAGRLRRGGFGGPQGLAALLREERVAALIDATHPFAATMSHHARLACDAAEVPRLRLLRPEWRPGPGDRWEMVDSLEAAAARLPGLDRRVFLTIGTRGLKAFAGLAGHWFLVRLITPPPDGLPLPGELLCQRGPFTLEAEEELLRRHRIEVLVSKASGGAATAPKLAAARRLGLPVVLLRRPPPEPGEAVDSIAAALAWLAAQP